MGEKVAAYDGSMGKMGRTAAAKNRKYKNWKAKAWYSTLEQLEKDLEKIGNEIEDIDEEGHKTIIRFKMLYSPVTNRKHLFFYDPDFIKRFKRHEIFLDGTFKSKPNIKDLKQILTIMGKIDGKVFTFYLHSCIR